MIIGQLLCYLVATHFHFDDMLKLMNCDIYSVINDSQFTPIF